MVEKGGTRRFLAALVGMAVVAGSPCEASAEQAARGRKESMPRARGPRTPTKLPASVRFPAGAPALERGGPATPTASRYANTLDALSQSAARFERSAEANYTYCLRTVATYEFVYFGSSGQLQRGYVRAVQHGTGFAFREKDGEYYVATNYHVAHLPAVTSAASPVDGVPPGARLARQNVFGVADEDDEHASGFIELQPVLADPPKDLAILKTSKPLKVMPHRLGSSAALEVGNLVIARGYPLGVMPAFNVGHITNPRHEDLDSGWDHVDFLTDAALNNGNSGSPVFAISRRSGEPELVGIFHAHYRSATGMGVVVGIDDIRDALEKLEPPPAAQPQAHDRAECKRMLEALGRPAHFPFGGRVARAVSLESGISFEVYEEFPATETLELSLFSGQGGTRLLIPTVDARQSPLRGPASALEHELWVSLETTLRLRQAITADDGSAGARQKIARLRRQLSAGVAEQKELLSIVDFESQALEVMPAPGELDGG